LSEVSATVLKSINKNISKNVGTLQREYANMKVHHLKERLTIRLAAREGRQRPNTGDISKKPGYVQARNWGVPMKKMTKAHVLALLKDLDNSPCPQDPACNASSSMVAAACATGMPRTSLFRSIIATPPAHLSSQQQEAFSYILPSACNVFLTGISGSGKVSSD